MGLVREHERLRAGKFARDIAGVAILIAFASLKVSATALHRWYLDQKVFPMKIVRSRRVAPALAVCLLMALSAHAVSSNRENRCGWLQNPTPGNWWLDDKDGSWTLSVMGEPPVPGFDEIPDMSTKGWVVTNAGSHGYGCACVDMEVERGTGKVVRIFAAKPLSLKRCKADRALPAP
ncbi:DUF4087 domain-containing protein [Pandoraea sp. XJJ-1]|uniref:DUF4087 domain-containing protein n=1 Tax=Pandoraea sp. XJJ-1 TaxID=3002643 RepID=UPI00227F0985|nr:DUF4087 domain-containing protein [Pandoraea sp. XJJ-1]WAL85030.1 DUF4087 domain-containing protein [Pandoraea sp. XJJ-1]